MKVTIYTDGSCKKGQGGWGAIIQVNDKEIELYGSETKSTNNRMEIMAAIQALARLTQPHEVDLYTDSKYLIHGITRWIYSWQRNNWKTASGKIVKNVDLWQQLDSMRDRHIKVNWFWIRGHSGNALNDRADALARLAIK